MNRIFMERNMWILRFLTFPFLALALSISAVSAAEQTFAKPKAGPFMIDWCLQNGALCGKPAADKFCETKGYYQSNDFVQAVDIGAYTPTIIQGTGQVCNAPQCDGFTYVTCEKPSGPPPPPTPPPGGGTGGADERTYFKPKIGGYRLNYCETKGAGCGQEAADAFCEDQGFDEASDFVQSARVPPGVKPSRFIGNNRLCKGSGCYAFNSITCERQP
jgi:hypothetical protein